MYMEQLYINIMSCCNFENANKMHKTMNYTKMKTNVPIISMLLITNSCPHGPYLYIINMCSCPAKNQISPLLSTAKYANLKKKKVSHIT